LPFENYLWVSFTSLFLKQGAEVIRPLSVAYLKIIFLPKVVWEYSLRGIQCNFAAMESPRSPSSHTAFEKNKGVAGK